MFCGLFAGLKQPSVMGGFEIRVQEGMGLYPQERRKPLRQRKYMRSDRMF